MRSERTREEKRQSLLSYAQKSWRARGAFRGYDHLLELDDLYPEVGMFGPQCISAEFGSGWKDLLIPCFEVMKEHGCKAGQIKQKFCELKFYWDFPDHIEAAIAEWRAANPRYYKDESGEWKYDPPMPMAEERKAIHAAVSPVIKAAEELSRRTCEDCGADLGKNMAPKSGRNQCQACDDLDKQAAQENSLGPGRGRVAKHQE